MKKTSLLVLASFALTLLAGCSSEEKAAPIEGEIKTTPNAKPLKPGGNSGPQRSAD